jgi:hypothetical protein
MTKNNKATEAGKSIGATKEARDHKLTTLAQRVSGKLLLSEKFKTWASLFLDQSNREYWRNATKCALKVYNTDKYNSASCIGYQNYRKLQFLGSEILEREGFSLEKLLKIGAQKMEEGSYDDWEKFMEFIGYFPRNSKGE